MPVEQSKRGVLLLGGVGFAIVTLCVYLSLEEKRDPKTLPLPTAKIAETEKEVVAQLSLPSREALVTETEVRAPRLTTTRQYLQDYWGSRWPELEAALLDAGWDLDQEMDLSLWPEWEDVKELAFATMISNVATIDPLTVNDLSGMQESVGAALLKPLGDRISLAVDKQLNPEAKRLSKNERDQLLEIEASHNEGITPLVDAYLVADQTYRASLLEDGKFEHGLFITPAHVKDPGYHGRTEVIVGSTGGWDFSMYIDVEKDPTLASLLSEIDYLTDLKSAELALLIESF